MALLCQINKRMTGTRRTFVRQAPTLPRPSRRSSHAGFFDDSLILFHF